MIVGPDYHIPPKNVGKSSETEAIIIIILLNTIGEKIKSRRKEREFWHLCESKKVLLKIQLWKSDMREKISIELDDYLLDFRKEIDLKVNF